LSGVIKKRQGSRGEITDNPGLGKGWVLWGRMQEKDTRGIEGVKTWIKKGWKGRTNRAGFGGAAAGRGVEEGGMGKRGE